MLRDNEEGREDAVSEKFPPFPPFARHGLPVCLPFLLSRHSVDRLTVAPCVMMRV